MDSGASITYIRLDIFLTSIRPWRFPRHLAHDPFQLVALALPLHGCAWQVSTKTTKFRNEIFAFLNEVTQRRFGQSVHAGLLVKQRTAAERQLLHGRIEHSPHSSLSSQSGDDATVELSSDWRGDETDRDDSDHSATLSAPLKLRCLFLVCCCILPLFSVFALMIAASAHAFG